MTAPTNELLPIDRDGWLNRNCLKCGAGLKVKVGPKSSWIAYECEKCNVSYNFCSMLSADTFFSGTRSPQPSAGVQEVTVGMLADIIEDHLAKLNVDTWTVYDAARAIAQKLPLRLKIVAGEGGK